MTLKVGDVVRRIGSDLGWTHGRTYVVEKMDGIWGAVRDDDGAFRRSVTVGDTFELLSPPSTDSAFEKFKAYITETYGTPGDIHYAVDDLARAVFGVEIKAASGFTFGPIKETP